MKQRSRIYYTETDKSLMWDRWQKGDSLNEIARLFGRGHSSIQRVFEKTDGIRPVSRKRSRLALTMAEREEISRGVVAGLSLSCIGASLGRAPSSISREINRNGGRRGYRASQAELPGVEHTDQRPVNLSRTVRWHASWRASCSCSGRHGRSQAG